jgi:asparagine synthase (glutamine-hydrolysing)
MPGIAGIISARAPHECAARVAAMLGAMTHDAGWVRATIASPELGVYAGSVDRPACEGLLRERAANGLAMCGHWDAPPRALDVERVNGLFCALQIDHRAQCAALFNDRYGQERLYVHEAPGEIHFASEAKALLAVLPSLRAFDETGVADYLTYGSVLEGRTLFRGIELLPGGSRWTVTACARVGKSRYFEPAQWEALPPLQDGRFVAELDATFERVLPSYLNSPRDVGISLTGGLDTRMIMSCLPRGATPGIAYTYADRRGDTLDVRIAAQVARECGVPHHTLRLDDGFLRDFAAHADATVYLSDGCASVLHTHEHFLSQRAAQCAPIRLTGNYGSEVLRAMSTFKALPLEGGVVAREFDPMLRDARQEQLARRVHPVTHAAFREIPWHLYGALAAAKPHLVFRTPYMDDAIVKLAYQASPAMRSSALPSLALIANHNASLSALPTDRGVLGSDGALRSRLRRAGAAVSFKLDYWHMEGMPRRLAAFNGAVDALSRTNWLDKHKFLPYRRWLREELASLLRQRIDDAAARALPFWHAPAVRALAQDHVQGRHNRLREINAVLTLEAVDRMLIRGRYPRVEAAGATLSRCA